LLKNFKEQAFLHELASVKWYRISLIPSVEDARTSGIVTKHTPINKIRIKNRFSPWFDRDLAELLQLNNCIWRKARHTHTQADWLFFWQMRNKYTQAIWKAKVIYFKEQCSLCGSNPKIFWKMVKDLENKPSSTQLPMSLNVDDVVVTDKEHMAEHFNRHFIKSGFLFYAAMPPCPSNISSSPIPSNAAIPDAPPPFPPASLQSFSLQAVTESEVLKKLLKFDLQKTSGSNGLDPYFFKVAAPIITKPV
jgi:hypothetical protein